MNFDDPIPYADIIDLPHHVSQRHPQMPMKKRAAQFSPFAALTGYEDAIKEIGRITEVKKNLDENKKVNLDYKLNVLKNNIKSKPNARIVYFIEDSKKYGGKYVTVDGNVNKIDLNKNIIVLNNITIPILDIVDINLL